MARAKEGKAKSTPWGSGYGRAPDILHGARETGCAMHATGCAMQRGVPWPCMVSLGGPAKPTPRGSGYGSAPEILHGARATGCAMAVHGVAWWASQVHALGQRIRQGARNPARCVGNWCAVHGVGWWVGQADGLGGQAATLEGEGSSAEEPAATLSDRGCSSMALLHCARRLHPEGEGQDGCKPCCKSAQHSSCLFSLAPPRRRHPDGEGQDGCKRSCKSLYQLLFSSLQATRRR